MQVDFNRWLRQPTTIHALGVVAAGIGFALTNFVTGNPKVDGAVAVVAYVLIHLGIDDHSSLESSAKQVSADVIHVGTTSSQSLIQDVLTLFNAVKDAAPMPAPAVVETPAAPAVVVANNNPPPAPAAPPV